MRAPQFTRNLLPAREPIERRQIKATHAAFLPLPTRAVRTQLFIEAVFVVVALGLGLACLSYLGARPPSRCATRR
jgi:hypothetical protein